MGIRLKNLVLILTAAVCWAWCQPTLGADPEKIGLSVIYYGKLDSARGRDFVSFLHLHFSKAGQGDLAAFGTKEAAGYDVAILDYDELKVVKNRIQMPPILFESSYSRPMMTLGATGALVCDRLRLKTGYL